MNDAGTDPPIIEFRNVSLRVGEDRDLSRELTLEVRRGETLVLLGRAARERPPR